MLMAGSIEEKVLQRQLAKQGLSEALVDEVGQEVSGGAARPLSIVTDSGGLQFGYGVCFISRECFCTCRFAVSLETHSMMRLACCVAWTTYTPIVCLSKHSLFSMLLISS